jgi:hypothetical protein
MNNLGANRRLAVERAVIAGRQEVMDLVREQANRQAGWEATDRPDWAVPVLYLHPNASTTSCQRRLKGQ